MSCCNNPTEHIFNSVCRFSIGPISFTDQTGGQMKISSIPCYGPMKYTGRTHETNLSYERL